MKRKLFSAILFGALLTASTSGLTSCKDYDDDISNLQSQIDKLATADQLSAKVSEMQAAISAAQSAAEAKAANAQTVADAAKAAAADAAAAASKAQSTADGATQAAKDAAAAAAAADEVAKAAKAAVDKLAAEGHATKAELEAAAKAAQAYVDSVKKAIEETHAADKAAIEKAIADGLAEVKAEIAKTNEELAALAKRLDACEEKLAAIEAGEGQEEALKAIQEEVEAVADALEAIIGEYTSMVTDVDLYAAAKELTAFDDVLSFVYLDAEKTTTFPAEEGVADAQIEFSEKNKNVTTTDSLLVRVSPTNAVLNPANVSLINSQGKDLSEFVEVKEVKPYNELITRSAEGNGLWNVVFKAKEGIDRAKFAEAVAVNGKQILFAVAVKNTESNDVRRVISAYEVTAEPTSYEPARNDFQVTDRDGKWEKVANLHNRFYYEDKDNYGALSYGENSDEAGKKKSGVEEYVWVNEPQVAGADAKYMELGDARSDYADDVVTKTILDVAVGQPIDISVATVLKGGVPSYIDKDGGIYDKRNASNKVKAFYVTLDTDFAIESSPSELKAWKSYNYTNVGIPGTTTKAKLFYGGRGSISIDDEDAFGDVIGFRVYAVNLDGTLVDPDGRAFYVRVGGEQISAPLTIDDLEATLNYEKKTNTYSFVPDGKNYYSKDVALSDEIAAIANDVKTMDFEITVNPSAYGNNIIEPEYRTDYEVVLSSSKGNDVLDQAHVVILDPTKFLDDAEYTAVGTLKDANGMVLSKATVKFTKVLPTEAPALSWAAGWNAKEQIISNTSGDYKVGVNTPQAIELTKIINYLDWGNGKTLGTVYNPAYYDLTFKNIKKASKEFNDINVDAACNYVLNAATASTHNAVFNKYAVDGAEHEIAYTYNFGEISLKKNYTSGNTYKVEPWKVAGESLSMTFNSWIDFEEVAWKDGKKPTVVWGSAKNEVDLFPITGATSGAEKVESVGVYVIADNNPNLNQAKYTTSMTSDADKYLVATIGATLPTTGLKAYRYNKNIKRWCLFDLASAMMAAGEWTGQSCAAVSEKWAWVIKYTDGKYYLRGDNKNHKTGVDADYEYITMDDETLFAEDTYKLDGEKAETIRLVADMTKIDGEIATSGTDKNANRWVCKKSGNNYYKVSYDEAKKVWRFVGTDGKFLAVSDAATVADKGVVVDEYADLFEVKNLVKAWEPGKPGDQKESVLSAWNTVMSYYTDANGKTFFGTAAKPADLMKDLSGKYTQEIGKASFATAEADPFTVSYDEETGKLTFTRKTTVANPTATEGTLTITTRDCFNVRDKVWKLKYTIKVN